MPNPVVTDLHIYPVKSCRGTRLERASLTERGLAGDRLYQVVDDAGAPITQRQQAAMATVQPTIIDDGLRLEAEGAPTIEVARPTTNDTSVTSLLGVPVEAANAGAEAAAWFSDLLGVSARLVALTDESDAHLPLGEFTSPLSWADASPFLVANQASLDWLAERATESFAMDRFRPNITVTGADPWVEDTWSDFTVGASAALLPLPWPRCAIPQIDQLTGERHKEPAKILRAHRWCESVDVEDPMIKGMLEGNALFGIACALGPVDTVVSVGDELVVGATGDPLIPAPA